jgi:TetR/AcrR family acrAB operon transcriptional repressor
MADGDAQQARGKRARTRAKLVDAAAQLVRERGFERTSLEDVAARAGMTRGAIYGNFRNRDDLFLAVVAARWEPILPPFEPGADFATHMERLADAVIAALPARRAAAVGAASFQVYALTHPEMQARVAAANAEIYRRMADGLRAAVPGGALPMPAEDFVRAMHALIDGLMFLHALTPDLVGAQTIRAACAALARAATAVAPCDARERSQAGSRA